MGTGHSRCCGKMIEPHLSFHAWLQEGLSKECLHQDTSSINNLAVVMQQVDEVEEVMYDPIINGKWNISDISARRSCNFFSHCVYTRFWCNTVRENLV